MMRRRRYLDGTNRPRRKRNQYVRECLTIRSQTDSTAVSPYLHINISPSLSLSVLFSSLLSLFPLSSSTKSHHQCFSRRESRCPPLRALPLSAQISPSLLSPSLLSSLSSCRSLSKSHVLRLSAAKTCTERVAAPCVSPPRFSFLFFTFVTDVVGSHRFLFSFCFLRVRACARSLLLGPAPSWCGSVSASSLYSSLSLVSSRKSTHLIAIPTFYWRYTEDPLSYRHSLSPPTATALSSLI